MDMNLPMPLIDGHFWVERDGSKIDTMFKQYRVLCQARDCTIRDIKYIEAPVETQQIMFKILEKSIYHTLIDNRDYSGFGYCYLNAIREIRKNGGRLVFGSLGFKYINKGGYFYEYGGENYKTVKDFMKTVRYCNLVYN